MDFIAGAVSSMTNHLSLCWIFLQDPEEFLLVSLYHLDQLRVSAPKLLEHRCQNAWVTADSLRILKGILQRMESGMIRA